MVDGTIYRTGRYVKMSDIKCRCRVRSIERVLKISHVIVMKWVQDIASTVEAARGGGKAVVETMDLDEMWHYVGKKNGSCGFGWLSIETAEKSLHGNSVVVKRKREENCGKKSSTRNVSNTQATSGKRIGILFRATDMSDQKRKHSRSRGRTVF